MPPRGGDTARTTASWPPVAEVPPRVEYELTPLGHSLRPVLEPISTWAAEHVDEVLSLRKAHDARLRGRT
ncbi:winged helix-turn-helix transcriptional regulator [Streptomyces bobili]|uniref:winged helix-turn-helix transcriptional regulator n=1 Tax=Streptomyces bobili TaxID=67280 RepID=UPI0036FEAEC6